MRVWLGVVLLLLSSFAWSAEGGGAGVLNATLEPLALLALGLFVLAYILVMAEEVLHLRKSKPVILAAGIIWMLVAAVASDYGVSQEQLHEMVGHNLTEYAALFLFLLVAMTYINAMEERNVFEFLRSYLVLRGFSFRTMFWLTGFLAFFISPMADNLTTALLMGAVIMAVGHGQPRFLTLSMINVVVGANAGGAFSPFGDITTLMVWQSGKLSFTEFFSLFLPALVNFVVPAALMYPFLPKGSPEGHDRLVPIKRGGKRVCLLFLATIALAVTFKQVFSLPPFMGMMMGFALLMFFAFFLRITGSEDDDLHFDIFGRVARAEWDTLLFFFGVIFCVGGLAYLGYLQWLSHSLYDQWGATISNIAVGVISAVVDNIPVMYAILTMSPDMSDTQWLLVTMTAGVGGSLLSVGSAAGVALMGQARGVYTFFSHLKWSWAIGAGYAASIAVHFWING
ncbi:sodium:proton antiporter NhaD [Marinobacteraceae bacterium S3BR75-40.1]